jgi:hypothetical protein
VGVGGAPGRHTAQAKQHEVAVTVIGGGTSREARDIAALERTIRSGRGWSQWPLWLD